MLSRVRFVRVAIGAALAITGAACASEPTGAIRTGPERATVTVTATPSDEPTADVISTPACGRYQGGDEGVFAHLTDVRVGRNAGFDRIVFEFDTVDGPPQGVPRYQLSPEKPPFKEDGSGSPIEVGGEFFTRLILHGASGYDMEAQEPTYDGPREFEPGLDVIAAMTEAGDFEATMTWIVGLEENVCPQVSTLFDPNRLVVDFPNQL